MPQDSKCMTKRAARPQACGPSVIPTTALPSGERIPILGQGTWRMGEDPRRRSDEVAALRLGLDLGMRLIDTAEMYGEGGAEEVIAEAIAGRRDQVFLVSKLYPYNATRCGTIAACERSLKRLQTDRLDLYLLHWRGSAPLVETVEAFEELVAAGKIRYWGVSNFGMADMRELMALPNGTNVTTDQVLYNPAHRGIELDLLPWCRRRGIPIMAYSPVEQGRIRDDPALKAVASRHEATPAQVALAWLLRQDGIVTIPKASTLKHVRENRAAVDLWLTIRDVAELARAFPRPRRRRVLEML